MDRRQQRGRRAGAEAASVDPMSLRIVLWLGTIVAIAGLTLVAAPF